MRSEEVEQFPLVDAARSITIDPLEGRVRRKVSNVAETLAKMFETAFAITDGDEQIPKSVFRIVAKHKCVCLWQREGQRKTVLCTYFVLA